MMNTRLTMNKLRAATTGLGLALVLAACSSGSNFESVDADTRSADDSSAQTPIPAPPPAAEPARRGDGLEEVTVTAARSGADEPRREAERAVASSSRPAQLGGLSANRALAVVEDAAALARVAPGEEVWIISRGGDTGTPGPVDDAPGTGALLATLIWPDDTPPAQRRTEEIPLPLEHTDVHARIDGYVSTVDVRQQFANPYDQKIEAVYLFPLPEKSAVREFVMTIGERRIRGILREREQAEQIYAQARAQGYQASLLTQHRPNIFEQKVANIEPGHRIDVNIRYFHTLTYNDGWYSFVFPTVVGPRYNPPGSSDPIAALPRDDFAPSGTAVHYLAPHERSGHDISIQVDLAPGVSIEEIDSTHALDRSYESDEMASVALAHSATIPNRDFVLNFRVAGRQIRSNLLTWVDPETQQGYFTMMMYPPSDLESLRRQPLELVFVLDCSGSMAGAPMEQSKAAILAALQELRPDDTFQIIRFSNNSSRFGPEPVPATRENVRRAEQYVRTLSGTGGTQMIEGIKAALDFPHDPARLRFVTFLTDGYIGNEAEILGAIHARLGAARIFSFGVGASPNRYLLERMAGVGRGAVAYLGLEDSGSAVMDSFFDRISHPAMLDIDIDWNGMRVADVFPARLPDLFVGRSVIVTGRFDGTVRTPVVHGRAAGRDLVLELPETTGGDTHDFIAPIWARLKIAALEDRRAIQADPTGELTNEILSTALAHNLMSDYTAFVAVDASRVTQGTQGTTVYQAVPVPQGVRYETTIGH